MVAEDLALGVPEDEPVDEAGEDFILDGVMVTGDEDVDGGPVFVVGVVILDISLTTDLGVSITEGTRPSVSVVGSVPPTDVVGVPDLTGSLDTVKFKVLLTEVGTRGAPNMDVIDKVGAV